MLTGKDNNICAPDYFIAAVEAAIPYGKQHKDKEMPVDHVISYGEASIPSVEEALITTIQVMCGDVWVVVVGEDGGLVGANHVPCSTQCIPRDHQTLARPPLMLSASPLCSHIHGSGGCLK